MVPNDDETVALLALLHERKKSWGHIASTVVLEGSAVAVRGQSDEALFDLGPADDGLERARAELESWTARGLRLVTVLDARYPQQLLDIRETPPFLFFEGALRSDDPGMSVVGSRGASAEGIRLAARIAEFLVSQELTVISGLAAGVDTAAHRAALDAGGRTVAFIGTGITKSYPAANAALQREIAERGLVLSQFFPEAAPSKQSFPMRNASMSGYGLATIVVEANEHSGTRIQARLAGQHGRPVILTDSVVRTTTWGAELNGQPGVYVVSSLDELGEAVHDIREQPKRADKALAALMSA
ncbi:DNA-processing protein DprA [Myceligenerans crystallogenes]|uniref:Smf/DprA SLOG domain-containing protein n=1 Tax=Myceligenerans crystallogenes TaxID=316335 RepID=A0ABN2NM16_9MICO